MEGKISYIQFGTPDPSALVSGERPAVLSIPRRLEINTLLKYVPSGLLLCIRKITSVRHMLHVVRVAQILDNIIIIISTNVGLENCWILSLTCMIAFLTVWHDKDDVEIMQKRKKKL